MCNFFLKIFKIEILKMFKMIKNNIKFIRAAYWINSKVSNRDKKHHIYNNIILSVLLVIIMVKLLKVFNFAELHLKLAVQTQLPVHPVYQFLINNCNVWLVIVLKNNVLLFECDSKLLKPVAYYFHVARHYQNSMFRSKTLHVL